MKKGIYMAKKEKNTKETAKKNKQPPKKNIKKTPKKERLFEDDMMIDVVGRFKDTLKLMEKQEKKAPPKKEKASPKREKSQPAKPGKKPAEKAKNSQKQSKKASPAAQPKQPLPKIKRAPVGKLKIISLGGLNEIGKNLTVFEYENDMIIVDCGLGFPDDDMPGVDLVIPDFSYLEENREKIRGVLLTHGHEDHIGAIPYLLRVLNPPIFGTNLTLGIIKNKLLEHQLPNEPKLQRVNAGDKIRLGAFDIEFIHVNHSIADACALAIETPLGTVIHTGDFKLDVTPIDGEMMNITRLGEIGNEGVLALLCESTNAERPGYTPSEKKVGRSLDYIFNTN